MTNNNTHDLFLGYRGTSTAAVRVQFRRSSGAYQLRTSLRDDGSSWKTTSWFTISDAPHSIEIYWRAATGSGANNGGLTLWIDGIQRANLTGVDNDTRRIDRVAWSGGGIDPSARILLTRSRPPADIYRAQPVLNAHGGGGRLQQRICTVLSVSTGGKDPAAA
jgi:hypothetical protein